MMICCFDTILEHDIQMDRIATSISLVATAVLMGDKNPSLIS